MPPDPPSAPGAWLGGSAHKPPRPPRWQLLRAVIPGLLYAAWANPADAQTTDFGDWAHATAPAGAATTTTTSTVNTNLRLGATVDGDGNFAEPAERPADDTVGTPASPIAARPVAKEVSKS